MRVAADGLAAIAVVGQQLGFVADADLPHFDPRLKFGGQRFHQVAKIDAVFGQVIDDEPLAAEDVLDIDELHRQAEAGDVLAGRSSNAVALAAADGVSSLASSADISPHDLARRACLRSAWPARRSLRPALRPLPGRAACGR